MSTLDPNQVIGAFARPHVRRAQFQESQGWIVPGLLPSNGLVVLASRPKAGKTCFATALAIAVSQGKPFLGRPVLQPGPVLWCAHEEIGPERLALEQDLRPEDPFYVGYGSDLPALDADRRGSLSDACGRWEPAWYSYVFNDARYLDARLIVVDSLHAAVVRSNLAENFWARRIMGQLRALAAGYGITVLVLHHLTKSATRGYHPERFADSAQILASASHHFFLDSRHEQDGSRILTLRGEGREPVPDAFLEVRSRDVRTYELLAQEPSPQPLTAAERILEHLQAHGPATAQQLRVALEMSSSTTKDALRSLRSTGQVVVESAVKPARYLADVDPV